VTPCSKRLEALLWYFARRRHSMDATLSPTAAVVEVVHKTLLPAISTIIFTIIHCFVFGWRAGSAYYHVFVFYLGWIWLSCVTVWAPEPYLVGSCSSHSSLWYLIAAQDEVFHIPQAQKYCAGEYKAWDEKITTPPGLWVSPMLAALGCPLITLQLCSYSSGSTSPSSETLARVLSVRCQEL
jgi:hypothetical protein